MISPEALLIFLLSSPMINAVQYIVCTKFSISATGWSTNTAIQVKAGFGPLNLPWTSLTLNLRPGYPIGLKDWEGRVIPYDTNAKISINYQNSLVTKTLSPGSNVVIWDKTLLGVKTVKLTCMCTVMGETAAITYFTKNSNIIVGYETLASLTGRGSAASAFHMAGISRELISKQVSMPCSYGLADYTVCLNKAYTQGEKYTTLCSQKFYTCAVCRNNQCTQFATTS